MRMSQQESTLEPGWLLAEMQRRFGYSREELAQRFDRSLSWVSRRLALAELLPEVIQQQVRDGNIPAPLAMKYLVPMARVTVEDCERMAAGFVKHRCDNRQAGLLYAAWRDGSRVVRERILTEPELFLKTQRPPSSTSPVALALERELDGRRHPASRQPAAGRSVAGDEWSAAGTSATPHRKRAGLTGADGGANLLAII